MVNNLSELEQDIQTLGLNMSEAEDIGNRKAAKRDLSHFLIVARLFVSLVLFAVSALLPVSDKLGMCLYIAAFLIAGIDFMVRAVTSAVNLNFSDESVITMVSCGVALAIGYSYESAAILILSRLVELLPGFVRSFFHKSYLRITKQIPETVRVLKGERILNTPIRLVGPGSVILINPLEPVFVDGIIVSGETTMDTSLITGHPHPKKMQPGDEVLAGYVNNLDEISIKVTASVFQSALSRTMSYIENTDFNKRELNAPLAGFMKVYIPAVIIAATAGIILQFLVYIGSPVDWFNRVLLFLVISCPCALFVSIPLTYFSAIAAATKSGLLFSSPRAVETLSKVKSFLFDKTGTFTVGEYKVVSVEPEGISPRDLLMMAAHAFSFSSYAHSSAIVKAYDGQIDKSLISSFRNYTGMGISIMVGENNISCGSVAFMDMLGVPTGDDSEDEDVVHVAVSTSSADRSTDNYESRNASNFAYKIAWSYAGRILLSDTLKEDSSTAVFRLHKLGAKKIVMLSEDKAHSSRKTAVALGIHEYHSECLPEDKLDILEDFLEDRSKKDHVAFVGNGICNCSAIAMADSGICIGTAGTDNALSSSDVVIPDDSPLKVTEAYSIALLSRKIAVQNITFSLCIKLLAVILCVLGYIPLWGAVIFEAAATAVTVINAVRTKNVKTA